MVAAFIVEEPHLKGQALLQQKEKRLNGQTVEVATSYPLTKYTLDNGKDKQGNYFQIFFGKNKKLLDETDRSTKPFIFQVLTTLFQSTCFTFLENLRNFCQIKVNKKKMLLPPLPGKW